MKWAGGWKAPKLVSIRTRSKSVSGQREPLPDRAAGPVPLLRPVCPSDPSLSPPGSLSGQGSRRRPEAAVLRLEETPALKTCRSTRGHADPPHWLTSFPSKPAEGEGEGLTGSLSPRCRTGHPPRAWPGQGKWHREIQKTEGKENNLNNFEKESRRKVQQGQHLPTSAARLEGPRDSAPLVPPLTLVFTG